MKKKIFTKVLATAMIAPLFLVGCNNSSDKTSSNESQNQSTDTTPSTPVAPVKNTVTLKADKNFELKSSEAIVENGKPFKLEVPNLDKVYTFDGWYTEAGEKITDSEGNSIENWDETLGDIELTAVYYGNYEYEEVGEGLRVSGGEYTNELDEIFVPAEVNGKKVLEVGDFSGHKEVKKVSLPNTVTTIAATAFSDLGKVEAYEIREIEGVENPVYTSANGIIFADEGATLVRYPLSAKATKYDVPNTVTKIAPHAFEGYPVRNEIYGNLTEVNLPATITEVGDYAFFMNAMVKKVTFAESTTPLKLGDFAFSKCPVTGFKIPANTVSIGNNCFAADSKTAFGSTYQPNLGAVVIPEGCTSIGNQAFYYNKKTTTVSIPSSVTSIGESAFAFTNITKITIDKNTEITEIPDSLCFKATKLTTFEIPATVKSIGTSAFESTKINSVSVPQGVTTIGPRAFADMKELAGLTIPSSVTTFGEDWIVKTPKLTADNLHFDETVLVKGADGVIYNAAKTEIYLYPSDLKATTYVMPETVKKMPDHIFQGNLSLTSVTLSPALTEISGYAFYGCENIAKVEIPASVTVIGQHAFGCSDGACTKGVGAVTFQEGSQLKTVDKLAFDGAKLKTLTLPEGVESIGSEAFIGSKFETISIPSTVKAIGNNAFSGLDALKTFTVAEGNTAYVSVDGVLFDANKTTILLYPVAHAQTVCTLPETVTTIGYRAFYGSQVTKVTGINVTTIDDEAFYYADKITTVDCPNLEVIGNSVFEIAYNHDVVLSSINLSKVKTIGTNAFNGASQLKEVTLGENLEVIGDGAFQDTSISKVNISGKVKTIGANAFAGTKVSEITLGEGIERIGEGAFNGLTGVKEVTIPNSVRYIEADAFKGCGLTKLNIADGVKYINEGAFAGNPLTEITVSENNRFFKANEEKTILLTKDGSELVLLVDAKEYVIPETVKTFRNGSFASMTKLEKITVSNQACYDIIFENNEFRTVKTIVVKKGLTIIEDFDTMFEKVEANQTVEGYDVYTLIAAPTPTPGA